MSPFWSSALVLGLAACGVREAASLAEGLPVVRVLEGPARCAQLAGVESVDVPGAVDGTRLRLRYRVFAGNASGRVLFLLPGGPGSPLMERDPRAPYALGAPRAEDTLIVIDARGSGCNAFEVEPSEAQRLFTTETVASDVLEVVRARGLEDYVLYGASFGTTTAVIAAARSVERGLPPPRLVVLEGVVGRQFDGFDPYFFELEREWQRVKPTLPAAWRQEFDREPWSSTLFYSREQWGAFITQQLILGESPRDGHLLNYWLDALSRKDPTAQRYVAAFMSSVDGAEPSALFSTIACAELWGAWKSGRVVTNGALRAAGEDLCVGRGGAPTWDSTRFQPSVPIVVFHGPFDPTTTTAQARYFVDGHLPRPRLVTVPRASHAPLTLGLAGRGCAHEVWSALLNGASLEPAIATCSSTGTPVTVE